MAFQNIASGLKLSIWLARVLANPEEEIIRMLNDFSNEDNSEISELKTSLCKKLECDNINIIPDESSIIIEFQGIKKPLDVFAVNLVGYTYNLLDKVKMFINPFLPEGININEILNNLSVTHNEITNTCLIEFPTNEDIISLEVKYEPETNTASIEIPIHSEKVLEKLKDMREK